MKVDALWLVAPKKIEIRQVEVSEPGYGQIQIEIKACGICKWDQYLFKGASLVTEFPFMFGHEGAGIVLKVGEGVKDIKPGDNVMCCGGADSMAQIVNMPAANAAVITTEVKDFGLWVGEPISCVINSIAHVPMAPADEVVVIGTGYMGLLKIQGLAKSLAGRIIAFDIDDRRLALAKEFGADEVYNSNSAEAAARIAQIIANGGTDYIIECSSTTEGFAMANAMLKNAGVLEMFAWHRGNRTYDGTPWHLKGISIYNTAPNIEKFYAPQRVKQTEKLISKGVFKHEKLVTHRTDYHHAEEAIERAILRADGYIKGVITF